MSGSSQPRADRQPSLWEQQVAANPGHSTWYVERFRKLAADGVDIVGEARLIDAMLERGSRVLDAGCGPGRLGGYLHGAGHTVVGVDVDPVLIEAAEADYPGPTWLVGDLSELHLAKVSTSSVCGQRPDLRGARHAGAGAATVRRASCSQGRAVVGFGAGRDYAFEEFAADAAEAGLRMESRFSTWSLRPFERDSDFLVAIMTAA